MLGPIGIILFGIATAMNIAVIKMKIEKERYPDAILDATLLVVLAWIFGGSVTGLAVATVASAFISLYLFISPPDILIQRLQNIDEKKKKKKKKKKKVKKRTFLDDLQEKTCG